MNNIFFENIYAGLFIREWKNIGIEDRKIILERAKYKSFKEGGRNLSFTATFSVILVIYFILLSLIPIIYFETHLIMPVSVLLTVALSFATYSFVNFLIMKKEILNILKTQFLNKN